MNKVCLVARLTAKPELRYTNSNTAFTRFTVAVNSGYRDNQKTDFINILAWKNQAENVCKYLDKGSLIAVEGRIQTGVYEDKEGNKKTTFDVVAETVQFLENKKGQSTGRVTPEEVEQHRKKEDNDPFQIFMENIETENDFLD